MFLTNKARYAVMAMLEIAVNKNLALMKLSQIAKNQEIEVQFLEQIFAKLKKSGLVEAVRGPGGGYKLRSDIREISVSDIVDSVEEEIKMTRCSSSKKTDSAVGCMRQSSAKCHTHHLWANLEDHIRHYLQSKTLHDVLHTQDKVHQEHSKIYLDHNATTKLLPEVQEAMAELYRYPLNTSSVHAFGRFARSCLENARSNVKTMIGADKSYHVVFTASGTEANNLAILGMKGVIPLISVIEHASIRDLTPQALLKIDTKGLLDLASLEAILNQTEGKPLVSVMLANNEIGTIQPISEIAKIVHNKGGLLHTDASQCPGKIPIDIENLGADMMTLSAHKFGGPLGAAALVFKKELDLAPLIKGGGQEYRLRSGTHSIQAIHGFSAACLAEPKYRALISKTKNLRDHIETKIAQICQEVVFFGQEAPRLPNTSSFSMPGVRAESQIMHFDMNGIAASAGSACSSGSTRLPHVHMAMGYTEEIARSAIRISLGIDNTLNEADTFVKFWQDLYKRSPNTAHDKQIIKLEI